MLSASRPPVRSNRPEMRGRAPLPVPSGLQNGHSRNPSSLDMARSPPNPSNKSTFFMQPRPPIYQHSIQLPYMSLSVDHKLINSSSITPQTLNTFLANSSVKALVRLAPLVRSCTRPMPQSTMRPVNTSPRYELTRASQSISQCIFISIRSGG